MDRTDIEECECPVEGHMTGCPNDLWAKALCDLERGKEPVATVVDQLCDLALRDLERGKEPVALLLPEDSINDIQAESIKQLISRAKHAHYVDVKIRINGQDEHYQADWLKHLQLSAPPASSGTVQVPRLVATAPKRIYLGVFDDVGVEQQDFPEDHEGITWCTDNVGHADVEYIRADLAAAPGAK